MWKFFLANKDGKPVSVTDDNCLSVSDCGAPPFGKQKTIIFNQFFTDDGLTTGSNDLGIDGSVTPVEFEILANNDADRYITRISFVLGYASSGNMYEFADDTALANGVKVSYFDSFGDEVIIMNPKANLSFMRASGIEVSILDWQTRNFAASGDYGYWVNIDLAKIMPPYGIKLDIGTKQRACITIRDDCTKAILFNCFGFGFERI